MPGARLFVCAPCLCCALRVVRVPQVTGASSWERPLEYATPRYDGQIVLAAGNNGWTKHWDDTHKAEFYHNDVTGETTWHRPVEYTTPRPLDTAGSANDSMLSAGWSKFWDDVNHTDYYYNAVSGAAVLMLRSTVGLAVPTALSLFIQARVLAPAVCAAAINVCACVYTDNGRIQLHGARRVVVFSTHRLCPAAFGV